MSSAAAIIGGADCKLRSRTYLSGPRIYFLHTTGQATVLFDQLQQLPFPCNTFFIVSNNHVATTLYLATKPTNRSGAGATITPNGTEEWFPMTAGSGGVTGSNYLSVIRFKETLNQIFLSIGAEGGATTYTIACMQDDEVQIQGGPWG
jgi:hypothetical protein